MTRTKIKYMSALLAAATLTAVASAGVKPAEAAILRDTTLSSVGNRLIDFNGDPSIKTFFPGKNQEVSYTGGGIVSGSVGGQYAAPAADANGDIGPNANFDDTQYLSTGGTGQSSPVTFKFKYPIISNFGFLWGSIDAYNSISFLKGNTLLASFTGSDILNPANGDQGVSGTAYVNFVAESVSDYFDTVVLSSTSPAFEIDDVKYTEVPTPALLPGLVGIGIAALRKRKKAGEAQQA